MEKGKEQEQSVTSKETLASMVAVEVGKENGFAACLERPAEMACLGWRNRGSDSHEQW